MSGFLNGLKAAWSGLLMVLRSERNARIHLVVAIIVLLAGVALSFSNAELAAVFFAIILVFLAEVINTAFEKTLDLVNPQHDPRVAHIKDMSAAAVLVASIGAALIGAAIFVPHLTGLQWPL